MTPFLKQIAKHYIGTAEDISRLVFVFPSHRALVFFRKYLADVVKEEGHKAIIAPQLLSIDDFITSLSGGRKADNLSLVLRLYDCYAAICKEKGIACESLDEFVFWGNVIIRDFDDVDKYLIDAKDIFRNVSDIKDMGGDLSYLSETQKEAIKSFLGHFQEEGEFKLRFARLWNILGELYVRFNENLDSDGLCYGGRMVRDLACRMKAEGGESLFKQAFPLAEKVVFCGLNVLCEAEKTILTRLKNVDLAEFCWDWQSPWIRDSHNKSSLFMKDNLAAFPQSFKLEPCNDAPQIEVVSVPSAVGQTKVVSEMLGRKDIHADERTAIILPDESLLQPLLNSIPDRVNEVNVTMGYSMGASSFFTLMNDIAQLQLRLRKKEDSYLFYHRPFWNIVSNNLFDALLDQPGRDRLASIKAERNYFIACDDTGDSELLKVIFRPVLKDDKSTDAAQIAAIEAYQLDLLNYIGRSIAADEELKTRFALEMDFAMEYSKAVNLLAGKNLGILPRTYFALLDSSIRSRAVPIKGEPLTGLQIMGPLETRGLDFHTIFILSSNEGVFPRSSFNPSFIPPLLRSGFGLPSVEYQDAVWAYYFYRMIQRPARVVMLMDSRSEGMRSGEESRYIKQLRYHFGAKVKKMVAGASPKPVGELDFVVKTDEHIRKIHSKELSPTSLQMYISCSMQFYYSFVLELKGEEEISDTMDSGIIGNVYHKVMETLYKRVENKVISRQYLLTLLADKKGIASMVEAETMAQMHSDSIQGRDIVFCTMISKYVLKTLERDLEFMRAEGVDAFTILGLERTLRGEFGGFRFKGTVDRLDSFVPGRIRLVDYKTGKVLPDDVNINDDNADEIALKAFDAGLKERPKIALQFHIYDMLLRQNSLAKGKTIYNSVYSTRSIMHEAPKNVLFNETFAEEMDACLSELLRTIDNKEVAFVRKKPDYQDKTCEFCDFKTICGR